MTIRRSNKPVENNLVWPASPHVEVIGRHAETLQPQKRFVLLLFMAADNAAGLLAFVVGVLATTPISKLKQEIRPLAETTRRAMLAAVPAALLPNIVHAALQSTPSAAEGPFYPVALPNDHDNDLVRVAGRVTEAGGEILDLRGSLTDVAGAPIANGLIEIWQCDVNGVYLHPRSPGFDAFDQGFQGFGRAVTDGEGQFSFRTIVPAPYPGRTPHIHLKAYVGDREVLTTQYYLVDHPLNATDGLFNAMSPADQTRQSMTLSSAPTGNSAAYQTEIEVVVGT